MFSATLMTLPSAPTNNMSSGMNVFFIHMAIGCASFVNEQHPFVVRELLDEHQAARATIRIIREPHLERMESSVRRRDLQCRAAIDAIELRGVARVGQRRRCQSEAAIDAPRVRAPIEVRACVGSLVSLLCYLRLICRFVFAVEIDAACVIEPRNQHRVPCRESPARARCRNHARRCGTRAAAPWNADDRLLSYFIEHALVVACVP